MANQSQQKKAPIINEDLKKLIASQVAAQVQEIVGSELKKAVAELKAPAPQPILDSTKPIDIDETDVIDTIDTTSKRVMSRAEIAAASQKLIPKIPGEPMVAVKLIEDYFNGWMYYKKGQKVKVPESHLNDFCMVRLDGKPCPNLYEIERQKVLNKITDPEARQLMEVRTVNSRPVQMGA